MVRHVVVIVGLCIGVSGHVVAEQQESSLKPLVRVVDINVGESAEVTLCDGSTARVNVVDLKETRDPICFAVRRAEVTIEVNGKRATLVSATYHRPTTVAGVQIDCSITKGYNSNGDAEFWNLDKDVRLRLWPADSPLIAPGTFTYPVRQRWFASHTQMANVPVFVDGGERPGKRRVYYHSGLDIGGAEGMVEVVAATDALVVSVGDVVLDGHKEETPVSPRYDVVYLLDPRGWYYRYSHLKEIDKTIVPGRTIKMGDRIGLLGKEGGSGGWSHLHFEIKSRQPSGRWGTQEGYAFLWEAYQRQYQPKLVAVARPHHLTWTGETVLLDATKSWSASGEIARYQWQFDDGTTASGAKAKRRYDKPGMYSEVLQIVDASGNVDYDFAVVQVLDRQHPEPLPPTIHPNYYPTFGITPGDEITFKVRTFRTTDGKEVWDFGDGSPPVEVQSDGNAVKLAPDGYAVTTHRYQKPGHYLVRVERSNRFGMTAVGHLHVHVEQGPKVTVVLGELLPTEGGPADGKRGPLDSPFGIDFDPQGNMMIVELGGGRVHKLDTAGKLTTIAGDGESGYHGDGGPAAKARFNGMHNVAVTPHGDIYIADSWNHCIRKIDGKTSVISTVAGNGKPGFSGDGGPATKATFDYVMCITLNPTNDKLYVADLRNLRIRVVDLKTGIVQTVAGDGSKGIPVDGAIATESPLVDPRAVAVDSQNRVYILERGGHALRVVAPDGRIRTVAGTGQQGHGDGPALKSQLNSPKHLCVDDQDNIIIADDQNAAIRRYNPRTQTLSTLLGQRRGTPPVMLSRPHGVCVERGRLYVVDTGNNRILSFEMHQ